MAAARPVIVRASGGRPQPWDEAVPGAEVLSLGHTISEAEGAALRRADCALVDGAARDAMALARRAHAADSTLQVVLVAPPGERTRIQRAMLFAPGLGEVWIAEPGEVGPALVERASTVTRQRRAYRAAHTRLEHDLAAIEPEAARRALVSDAYLASLLSVQPDPVLSIDPEGRILSWNAAAERLLGYSRPEAVGQPLGEMLGAEDPAALAALVGVASSSPVRGEIRFRNGRGEPGVGELAVAPVEAGGHRVRAVVLHDLTDERRVQQALEEQASELEAQATELEATQIELEETNADLQRTNQELATRTEEAEAANRAKSEFLATMSHEIRTPINAIIGYTDLLEMGIAGPVTERQHVQLERVRASSRHLLGLIENILDLAKVEASRMEVAHERALAVNAIAAALALVVPQAAEKRIRIEDPCADDVGTVYVGDENRVRQILANLLSNAVKFTEPEGVVRISCGIAESAEAESAVLLEGPWTYIRVADTGIGIAPAEVERVFRPFEQLEQGHTRTRGGTGLGLTISRQLARLMGGDLTVRSEAGAGSTFTLWLPSQAVIPPAVEEAALAHAKEESTRGFAAAGVALGRSARDVVDAYRSRLRGDAGVPMAAGVGDADLEDHAFTLLSDIAQNLVSMEASRDLPEQLLRDGGEIQRVISALHGAQRARLGWTETALRREFVILREEADSAVRRRLSRAEPARSALDLVSSFLEQAERFSVEAFRKGRLAGAG